MVKKQGIGRPVFPTKVGIKILQKRTSRLNFFRETQNRSYIGVEDRLQIQDRDQTMGCGWHGTWNEMRVAVNVTRAIEGEDWKEQDGGVSV